MKNSQNGFVVPLLIAIIALLVIGGGIYIYGNKKVEVQPTVDNGLQQLDQVQQTNTQNPSVTNQLNPVINQQNISNNPPVIKTNPVTNPIPVKSSITVSSPNGQEVWVNGSQQTIHWTSKGSDATQPVVIILERKSPNDTQFWNIGTIATGQPGSGIYTWTVSSKDTTGNIVANSQYKILIGRNLAKGSGPVDESDGYFLIASPSTVTPNPLSITVTSPSAGSVLQVGQPYKITWSGHFERGDEVFGINSYPVGSDTFGTIATVPIAQASCTGGGMGQWANPSTCSYTWTPTGPTPRLQISVFNNRNGDQPGSSGIFSVIPTNSNQLSITISSPREGDMWKRQSRQEIKWAGFSGEKISIYIKIPCMAGYSCDTFAPYNGNFTIAKDTYNTGSYDWTVGQTIECGAGNTTQCPVSNTGYQLRVCSSDGKVCDSKNFVITSI